MMSLKPTLCVTGAGDVREVHDGLPHRVFAFLSMGIDTKANTLRAAAYPRVVICVSLRMAASVDAPSAPMPLYAMLQARGRMGTVRE